MPANCASIQELDSMVHCSEYSVFLWYTPQNTISLWPTFVSNKTFSILIFPALCPGFQLAFHAMSLHVRSRLIQLLLTFSCKYGFGLQPTHYPLKGCLIDKSLQVNRKISCMLLFYFLLQRSAWNPSCAVPRLRPACSPRTCRRALRLPCIDFRGALRLLCIDFNVPGAVWSRGLSQSIAPYSGDAQGCPGALLRDLWRSWPCQGLCSPAVGMHATTPKKTLQPALSPEPESIPWASRGSSSHLFRRPHELHSLNTAASHLFTCLFFLPPPSTVLQTDFPQTGPPRGRLCACCSLCWVLGTA